MIVFYRILSESPNIQKISLMLEEVGLPFTVKYVDAHNTDEPDADFFKISPGGTVPAIVDTKMGVSIFESGAILYYLAEKSGKLLPANLKERTEVVKWLMFEVANVCPAMIEMHHYIMNDAGDIPDAIFERYRNRLVSCCSILEKQLEGREFLGGEYSIADIAIYPWVVTLEDMADINLSDYPNLKNWAKTIGDRAGG